MRVDLFDFELPEDRIALRPAVPRDSSKLLVVDPESGFQDKTVNQLPDLLQKGDVLVFNDTRVIPAQLEGIRERDGVSASIGATLHMRVAGNRWKAFVRGAKKLRSGDQCIFGDTTSDQLQATVADKGEEGEVEFQFDLTGVALDEALAKVGHIPLPPYIALKRGEDEQDRRDYQTVYAKEDGAVAAPTAGLHFTPKLLAKLAANGIERHFVTLHVGAGTFLPVKADDTKDHKMHYESGVISPDTASALNEAKARGSRIISVGTTSLRLLESAASETGELKAWEGATDIFITPGYQFRFVDMLMTNFHLPRSTLMMLVSAFSGVETMKNAYTHAIKNKYRFYSYGDSSLLYRAT